MGASSPPPSFEIRFRYIEATGDEQRRLTERLGLHELAGRASAVDREAVGLRHTDCLSSPDGDTLPLLVIEESATTGMYGPWHGARSKLWQALCAVGYTYKPRGEGGSYGYGKAGMIRGSATRTVLAYTCFEARPDDAGVTRRLLGMTYWGRHDIGEASYAGWARFGSQREGPDGRHVGASIEPFENEAADRVAAALGLDVRNPAEPEQFGTTFLLVEPTVGEHDLVKAIERNRRPALEDIDGFNAVVEGYEGRHIPRPRTDAVLRSFIDAYEVATVPQNDDGTPERRRYDLSNGATALGSLGLLADQDGWSWPKQTGTQDDQGIDHRNLVALVRKPRMVVEYLILPPKRNTGPPYVRGAFVADDSINEALQDTEPMGHDAWQTASPDGVIGAEQAGVAKEVIDAVGAKVRKFRRGLKPPERPPEDIRLEFIDSLMRRILRGTGPGRTGPTPDTRPVRIGVNDGLEEVGADRVRLRGRSTFSLSEHFEGEEAPARITIRYRLVEDERIGSDVALRVAPPDGFDRVGDDGSVFEGTLCREAVSFGFVSDPYSADWTGRLFADVDLQEPAEP